MKRVILTLLFAAAGFSFAAAQSPINVGIKAGVNLASLNLEGDGITSDISSDVSLVAGGFVRINLGKISIQPEILYSQKKFTDGSDPAGDLEYTLNEIDIPVLIGVDIIDAGVVKLRLVGGPMATLNLDNSVEFSGVSVDLDDDAFESARFGYAVGVSLDVTKLTFDVRYNGQFSDTLDPTNFGVSDLQSTANWFQVTVGFKFI